ncbi:hypothetical protein [Mailhella massiliensis]|uniref:hypothetical protein n=1 Tax=Mailhella massiliensis TaxID=1903261 RepID=UPI002353E708|nr:hypothetical protein [Mailhella massiliensis]
MAGLYVRQVSPNTSAPAMRVAVSQGAAGGIPRGGSVSFPREDAGLDAAKLGGLLGLFGSGAGGSEGVFNASVMPGAGRDLAFPAGTQAADTAAMLQGSNVDAASRMAEGVTDLPLPTMAGNAAGTSGAGMNADISGLKMGFTPLRAGSMLGIFGLGG